jgi:hypothetical protein
MAKANKVDLLSKEAAFKLADSVKKRGDALNNDIQKLAVTAIGYANVHGDVTIAQEIVGKIYDTLSTNKGLRFNSFVRYLETYGQLAYDKDAKSMVYKKRDNVLTNPLDLMLALSEVKWFDAIKQETPQSIYDVQDMLKKFIEGCERKANSKSNTVTNMQLIEQLKMFIDPNVEINVVETE